MNVDQRNYRIGQCTYFKDTFRSSTYCDNCFNLQGSMPQLLHKSGYFKKSLVWSCINCDKISIVSIWKLSGEKAQTKPGVGEAEWAGRALTTSSLQQNRYYAHSPPGCFCGNWFLDVFSIVFGTNSQRTFLIPNSRI